MELLCKSLSNETAELKSQGVRMRFIGDVEALAEDVRAAIARSEKETHRNEKLTLVVGSITVRGGRLPGWRRK